MSLRIRLILPIVIILIAVFLRFYRFEEFVTFLGDQGRDAVIIKRIVTFEHFPAIGPPSSLGQIFLGPFYYYLIAPFLLLFSFNPVGLAFGVAFLSVTGIIISYFIVKKEVNHLAALVFLIFLAFSTVNIQSSRFSWNPNLLPVFAFLTLYFFYKLLLAKNKWIALAFGALLSFTTQLHHLALLLFLPIFFIITYYFWLDKKNSLITKLPNYLISFFTFFFFSLPLLIFDFRHNFLNTRSFIKFFTEGDPTDHEQFLSRLLETNSSFYTHVFQISLNRYVALLLTFTIAVILIKKARSKKYLFLNIHFLNFIIFILTFSFFNSNRNAHYFGSIYFSFILVLAWIITNISKNRTFKFLAISSILLLYIFFNLEKLSSIFFYSGKSQVKIAENIADSILEKKPQLPFQTVALPYVETDGHIRYFLEIKGKRPLPADTLSAPKELYVLCFEKECQVLGNPQWQIAAFKKAQVDKIWTVEGVKIYKLIHEP